MKQSFRLWGTVTNIRLIFIIYKFAPVKSKVKYIELILPALTACFLRDISCRIIIKRNTVEYLTEKSHLEADGDYFIGRFLLNIRMNKPGLNLLFYRREIWTLRREQKLLYLEESAEHNIWV